LSRLGKVPLPVPAGVEVRLDGDNLEVQGPKGKLETTIPSGVTVEVGDGTVLVNRPDDSRQSRSTQGLVRRLASNMLRGVSEGFTRRLEITGVGYRADARGAQVHLSLGYSHPIIYQLPEGVTATVENQTAVTIAGIDRQLVGEVAAGIRKLRPPEPYKGKGIRYSDEHIRRKAGKAGAAG
jgi:large subunit ribosomal protein L6